MNRAYAYVEAPLSLGSVIQQSTNIMVVRVEKVDKEKNLIIYRKVEDLKGKHPTEVIKHNIGRGGFNPREWQYTMDWAEPGQIAVFFHNGGASETCIGTYWYQAYAGGEWWNFSHGEPFMLRSYSGKPQKLIAAVRAMLAGREVVVTCMADGDKNALHIRQARVQRMRASLKLQDYNAQRDFAGWGGGDDFVRLSGMPGFTHRAALPRVDPEAWGITTADFDGDGKPDLCLTGAGKIALLQNAGDALGEISLPGAAGARAAAWADYNGDGKPDLFLATPAGPRLYTNLGGRFRDDSHLLPRELCYNLTAAAWLDYDGDGRPDLLLGNGFHGLRLYRNEGPPATARHPFRLGPWHYVGPFENRNQQGFGAVYPPEKRIDLAGRYAGKNGEPARWREGKFADGQINNLLPLFRNNREAVIYLYREIDSPEAVDLPVSLGSDDTLTVWLNGQKILAQNEYRACAPDQARLILKLRLGKNALLLKICQGEGDWAFYFKADEPLGLRTWAFADVSAKIGLGPNGIGGAIKCHTLSVADVDGDGRPDFLYGGLLALNKPAGFVEAKDSGIAFATSRAGPVFGDYDADGRPDLFVPQRGVCKLFHNEGGGRFRDVSDEAGDLSQPVGWAACAAWGDFFHDGRLHLVVGCLRGPNRLFRNLGGGRFKEETVALGLHRHIFNTRAVGMVDVNRDGALDLVFNNEGQEAVLLLAAKMNRPDAKSAKERKEKGN